MNKIKKEFDLSRILKKIFVVFTILSVSISEVFLFGFANTKAHASLYNWGFEENYMFFATNFWDFDVPIFKNSGEFTGKYFSKFKEYPIIKIDGERAYVTKDKKFYVPKIFVTPTIHSKPARVFRVINDGAKVYKFKENCNHKTSIDCRNDLEVVGKLNLFEEVTIRGASEEFASIDFRGDATKPYFIAADNLECGGKFLKNTLTQKKLDAELFMAKNGWNFDVKIYRDEVYFNQNKACVKSFKETGLSYKPNEEYSVYSIKNNRAYIDKKRDLWVPLKFVSPLMMSGNIKRVSTNKDNVNIYGLKDTDFQKVSPTNIDEDLEILEVTKSAVCVSVRGYLRTDFGDFITTDYKKNKDKIVLIKVEDLKDQDLPPKWFPENAKMSSETIDSIADIYDKDSPNFIFKDYRENRARAMLELYDEYKNEVSKILLQKDENQASEDKNINHQNELEEDRQKISSSDNQTDNQKDVQGDNQTDDQKDVQGDNQTDNQKDVQENAHIRKEIPNFPPKKAFTEKSRKDTDENTEKENLNLSTASVNEDVEKEDFSQTNDVPQVFERNPVTVEDLIDFDSENARYAPYISKILRDSTDPNFSPSITENLVDKDSVNFDVISEKLSKIFNTIYFSQRVRDAKNTEMKPNAVQILAALRLADEVLCGKKRGAIGEIKTGEGKSFIIAVEAILLCEFGKKVDIATTNTELALRDYEDQKVFYEIFNVSSGVLLNKQQDKNFIKQEVSEQINSSGNSINNDDQFSTEALDCQVVYSTNCNFEWLYLKSLFSKDNLRNRPYDVMIVDEADNILLDQATSPALCSIPFAIKDSESILRTVYEMVGLSKKKDEILVILKSKFPDANFTDENVELLIKAADYALNRELGKDYIFKDDTLQIIDSNTGFIRNNTRWGAFVHEMIEIKEKTKIKNPTVIECGVTQLSFFKFYNKMIGVTGTIGENNDQEIFKNYYNVNIFKLPNNLKSDKKINQKCVNKTRNESFEEISVEVKEELSKGRPVLLIFNSINISNEFRDNFFPHAKLIQGVDPLADREAIIHAGEQEALTVATNAAGRGTDIKLSQFSRENGGLHVIILDLPSRKRTLDQSIGRTARQGSPGSATVYMKCGDFFYEVDDFCKSSENLFTIQTNFAKYLRENWPWLFDYKRQSEHTSSRGLVFPFGVKSDQVLEIFANMIADKFIYCVFILNLNNEDISLDVFQTAKLNNLIFDMVLTAWGNAFSYMNSHEKFENMDLCEQEYQNFISNLLEWLPLQTKDPQSEINFILQKTKKNVEAESLMCGNNQINDTIRNLLEDRRFLDYVIDCGCDFNDFSQVIKCLPRRLQMLYTLYLRELKEQELDNEEKIATRNEMKRVLSKSNFDDDLVTVEVSVFDTTAFLGINGLIERGRARVINRLDGNVCSKIVQLKSKDLKSILEYGEPTRNQIIATKSEEIIIKGLFNIDIIEKIRNARNYFNGFCTVKDISFAAGSLINFFAPIEGRRINGIRSCLKSSKIFNRACLGPFKFVSKASPYIGVALDVYDGINRNIESNTSTDKIVTDVAVDVATGVAGSLLAFKLAAIGSSFVLPPVGALAGGVAGLYCIDTLLNSKIDNKSIKDHVKDGLNHAARSGYGKITRAISGNK
ncbi:MAG: hypothetical protein LBI55_02710 [Oscillospiraceae bacterium]|jgi:hypothetical protein|nr:hypothetical protein [Oscillospiraceae bacterium]